jgi:hypothetical protein
MRKLVYIFVILFLHHVSNSQNHLIGANVGFYSFENPHLALNYQFNYKVLNTKIKSVFPYEFWKSFNYSINDLYVGLKTNDEKRHILYFNLGASFLIPTSEDHTSLKQQANPILNLGYSCSIKKYHRITLDISVSKWNIVNYDKWGEQKTSWYPYLIFEIGYAYRFKKRTKEVKTTN